MRDDIEFNIKFCELVENHPELYDYNQSSYSNRSVQDKAWELIAQELNESGMFIFLFHFTHYADFDME